MVALGDYNLPDRAKLKTSAAERQVIENYSRTVPSSKALHFINNTGKRTINVWQNDFETKV